MLERKQKMKKKKIMSALLALVLSLSLSVGALAIPWTDVDSWDKLRDAFADTDATVTIILSGDIRFLQSLTLGEGQTYILDGEAYTLTSVILNGAGSAEITASLNGPNGTAGVLALAIRRRLVH